MDGNRGSPPIYRGEFLKENEEALAVDHRLEQVLKSSPGVRAQTRMYGRGLDNRASR